MHINQTVLYMYTVRVKNYSIRTCWTLWQQCVYNNTFMCVAANR